MDPDIAAGVSPATRPPPPVAPLDRDRRNRPGYPRERPPAPWPNARAHPRRMTAPSAVPPHGRPGKQLPPVYSTAVPLRGLSGAIRRAAYRLPDHVTAHWTLLLLGDRVDAWGRRARRLSRWVLPAVAAGFAARWALRRA